MTHDITTQAGSGDVTPASVHPETNVVGGCSLAGPPPDGSENVIEAAKRDGMPVEPASGAIDAMNDRRAA